MSPCVLNTIKHQTKSYRQTNVVHVTTFGDQTVNIALNNSFQLMMVWQSFHESKTFELLSI